MSGAETLFLLPPSIGEVRAHVMAQVLARVLSARVERSVIVEVVPSYDDLAARLSDGDYDVAWCPPALRPAAEPRARVVLRPVRGGTPTYRSALVALGAADLPERGVAWLAGRRVAWVAPDSTAGYLLPRAHLKAHGVDPDHDLGDQRFCGSYTAALRAVLDGEADACALHVNSPDDGALRESLTTLVGDAAHRFVALAFTEPSPSDVLLVSEKTAPEEACRLAEALLEMGAPGTRSALLTFMHASALEAHRVPVQVSPAPAVDAEVSLEVDADGVCRRSSGRLLDQPLLGRRLRDVFPVEADKITRMLAGALAGEAGPPLEVLLEDRGGRTRWLTLRAGRLSGAPGTEASLLVSCTDVSEQRRLQEALVDLASFPVLDPNPVFEFGAHDGLAFANPAARRLLGEEGPGGLDKVRQAVRAFAEGTGVPELQLGETAVALSVKRLGDAGVLRVFGLDVTARRRMEEQLARNDRLASLGTLAAGVGHEINNPLAFVLANLEFSVEVLAEDGRADTPWGVEVLEALREAARGADRIRTIVRDLRGLARADEEKVGPLDLQRVVESTLAVAGNQIRYRARLVRDWQAAPPVRANEARLSQVVLNLVQNALDAMEQTPAPCLEVGVGTDAGGGAVLTVRDNGCGMTREVLNRVFEPFYTTKPVGKGTGLGLSICHALVVRMGGTIEPESTPGVGTTLRVRLPAAELAAPAGPLRAVPTPSFVPKRVLIIDDEPHVAAAVRRALRGHDLVVVGHGHEAIALLRGGACFDLVLCDLLMPEVDGMDVYRALAQTHPEVAQRMVFMTGGAFTPRVQEFVRSLSNPVLEKPFDLAALRRMVASARGG